MRTPISGLSRTRWPCSSNGSVRTSPRRYDRPALPPMWDEPAMRDERPGQFDAGHDWLDHDAGPVVRPYTVTGGRARPIGGLTMLTYVEAMYAPDADLIHLQPEHRAILAMTRKALSVAEIAAQLDLP